MMSKVNSSEFSVVDVRVTAIVVITVPPPVAVTALSLDYECVICVFVMGDSCLLYTSPSPRDTR